MILAPYLLLLLLSGCTAAALAVRAWRCSTPGAMSFAVAMLGLSGWAAAYGLSLTATDPTIKAFWYAVEWVAFVLVPLAWLLFGLEFASGSLPRRAALLVLPSAGFLALAWTNAGHGLMWHALTPDRPPLPTLGMQRAPGYWAFVAYAYAEVGLAVVLLVRALWRVGRLYRRQGLSLLAGTLVPMLANLVYNLELGPIPNLDLTPFASTVTGLVLGWGLLRLRLLDLVPVAAPVAHQAIVEGMADGVLVLDQQGTIVDLNPAAAGIVGQTRADLLGQPANRLFPHSPRLDGRIEGSTEVAVDGPSGLRHYDLRASSVRHRRGGVAGQLLVLRDVTERRRAEEAMRKLEEQNRLLIDNANDVVIAYDTLGRLTFVNRPWECLSGYSVAEALRMSLADILHPEDRDWVLDNLRRRAGGEAIPTNYELRIRRRDGQVRWVDANISLVRRGQEVLGLQAFVRDITDRKQAEEALRDSEERYRSVVDSVREVIFQTDAHGAWTFLNAAWVDITGFSVQASLGRPVLDVVHPEDQPDFVAGFDALLERRAAEWRRELRYVAHDSSVRWMEIFARPRLARDRSLVGTSGTLNDVTERRRAQAALAHQAAHDALTGLPNRVLLHERLQEAIATSRTSGSGFALFLIDLDSFKEVNDSLGHDAGDLLLREVARRLQANLRASDTVARLGGDEFAVLLPGADRQDAVRTAGELVRALAQGCVLEGHVLNVRVSIGITCHPTDGGDPGTLLRRADVAMYAAKRRRSGWAEYAPELDQHVLERLALLGDLRQGLDQGQLHLLYQPIVDLATGRLVEVEALVRWDHPQRGPLLPDVFIPLAEESGLIVPLGQWVLEEACRQARVWQELCPDRAPIVAVNLSARQFRQPDLADQIARTLRETRLEPDGLKLEITESSALDDAELAIATLRRLKRTGIQLAIDDFGTGYSSLAYLKRFPVDTLKIDKSFVDEVASSPTDAGIVGAITAFARTLGLRTTAEGIERAEQAARLLALGCDLGQGYHFARPAAASAIAALLGFSADDGRLLRRAA